MSIVTVKNKYQVVIPQRVREQLGISRGDVLEVKAERGKLTYIPKTVIDRSQFPNADKEYTPAQRRIIDARLAKADVDIKAGRMSEAFSSHEEFIASLHKAAAKYRPKKTKRPAR